MARQIANTAAIRIFAASRHRRLEASVSRQLPVRPAASRARSPRKAPPATTGPRRLLERAFRRKRRATHRRWRPTARPTRFALRAHNIARRRQTALARLVRARHVALRHSLTCRAIALRFKAFKEKVTWKRCRSASYGLFSFASFPMKRAGKLSRPLRFGSFRFNFSATAAVKVTQSLLVRRYFLSDHSARILSVASHCGLVTRTTMRHSPEPGLLRSTESEVVPGTSRKTDFRPSPLLSGKKPCACAVQARSLSSLLLQM